MGTYFFVNRRFALRQATHNPLSEGIARTDEKALQNFLDHTATFKGKLESFLPNKDSYSFRITLGKQLDLPDRYVKKESISIKEVLSALIFGCKDKDKKSETLPLNSPQTVRNASPKNPKRG